MFVKEEKLFCLEVWGDYACFTRPEMKVERVSYDVITPSAARAIFEAVLWKPAIKWHIRKIEVLKPIKNISIRRNEVGSTAGTGSKEKIIIEDNRLQRAGLLLRDVRYRLHAWMEYVSTKEDENPGKYLAMFERRAKKGQCFNQPYLGCREFSANFEYVSDPSVYGEFEPVKETRDLGFMLYDLDFSDPKDIRPAFYRSRLSDGIINVPEWGSDEVRR